MGASLIIEEKDWQGLKKSDIYQQDVYDFGHVVSKLRMSACLC